MTILYPHFFCSEKVGLKPTTIILKTTILSLNYPSLFLKQHLSNDSQHLVFFDKSTGPLQELNPLLIFPLKHPLVSYKTLCNSQKYTEHFIRNQILQEPTDDLSFRIDEKSSTNKQIYFYLLILGTNGALTRMLLFSKQTLFSATVPTTYHGTLTHTNQILNLTRLTFRQIGLVIKQ